MSATIIDGRAVADSVEEELRARIAALSARGRRVGLATVLVGEDPASRVYVGMKQKAAGRLGIESIGVTLPGAATQAEVEAAVAALNRDERVDAFLVQLPLPGDLDATAVVEAIDPDKDGDGLHPVNLGHLVLGTPGLLPATPSGVLRMLGHYGIETAGARVVVVGRSFLVGRPLAMMLGLKGRDATVTLAHSRTADLPGLCREADILVAAAGSPGLVGADHVKPGAAVIDVGTNRVGDRLVGDVDFDAVRRVAGAISPVPGGVGPMTIASLLANAVTAAERRLGR